MSQDDGRLESNGPTGSTSGGSSDYEQTTTKPMVPEQGGPVDGGSFGSPGTAPQSAMPEAAATHSAMPPQAAMPAPTPDAPPEPTHRAAVAPEMPAIPAQGQRGVRVREEISWEPVSDDNLRTKAPTWVFGVLRLAMGWTFLWPFLDKLFGLGYATPSAGAWIRGGSPTSGYLSGVQGPFRSFLQPMAGQAWADWVFMAGLACIGVALILGIGLRLTAVAGAALMVMMWMASLPLATNPFLDEHLIYALVLICLAVVNAGDTLGFGKWWSRTGLVRTLPVLR